jgi:toxin HigB-1
VIKSFKNALTEAAFNGEVRKGFPAGLIKVTRRKLGYLNAAVVLDDLRAPPANRLEALRGDRQGRYSIRVTINSEFVSSGLRRVRKTLNLSTTTKPKRGAAATT